MLPIQQKFINYNYTSPRSSTLQYIVIHDTGNTSAGANALAHYNYFNSANRNASAHYFVDDGNIIQTVRDTDASWHCGDGGGAYGITNGNSIGIEICINSDGNYTEAVNNTVDLTKYLMNKYSIPAEKVVRHYDASRKICPGTMSANNWAKWYEFKSRLTTTLYRVQVGAFSVLSNAENLADELKSQGYDAIIVHDGNYYKVQVGAFSVRENAENLANELKSKGYDAIIV